MLGVKSYFQGADPLSLPILATHLYGTVLTKIYFLICQPLYKGFKFLATRGTIGLSIVLETSAERQQT